MESTSDLANTEFPLIVLDGEENKILKSFHSKGKTPLKIYNLTSKVIRLYQKALKEVQKYLNNKPCQLFYVRSSSNANTGLIDLADTYQHDLFCQLVNICKENPTHCETFSKDTGTKSHKFCKTHFKIEPLKEGLVIFVNLLFNDREPYEHVDRFKIYCCSKLIHSKDCNYRWDLLRSEILEELLNNTNS